MKLMGLDVDSLIKCQSVNFQINVIIVGSGVIRDEFILREELGEGSFILILRYLRY